MKYLFVILLLVGCGRANTPYVLGCPEGQTTVRVVSERQSDKTFQATIAGKTLWLEPKAKPAAVDEDFCFDGGYLSDPTVEAQIRF